MSSTQTESTESDSADGIPDILSYGDRITYLESISIVNKYKDELDGIGLEDTFRLKHSELDRSAIHLLRINGLIEDSGNEFGRQTDWTPTRELVEIRDDILEWPEFDYLVLAEDEWECLERSAHKLREMEHNTTEPFQASDYGLCASRLASLHRHGFIEREEQRRGKPDRWRFSRDTVSLLVWLFQDDDWMADD